MPQKPIRLPPLRVLRVRNPNQQTENPCLQVMTSVLSCWASTGHNTPGCAALEQQLRKCMDTPVQQTPSRSTINYHLGRMAKHLTGPTKKK